ncbi:MAG TPA: helix-turn-helix domain-containing protein [Candidatus Latescibacteria bacterium]|nr:helix-turn-helix domain-containing protein [Candidatus Handelsmanbacteria bacterium]HIL09096.1 helix-turn-helix domain-containing protein [Candidatus Latescibacterota bacterium]
MARVLGVSPSTVSREIRRIGDWEIDLVMGAKHRGDWSR